MPNLLNKLTTAKIPQLVTYTVTAEGERLILTTSRSATVDRHLRITPTDHTGDPGRALQKLHQSLTSGVPVEVPARVASAVHVLMLHCIDRWSDPSTWTDRAMALQALQRHLTRAAA